MISDNTNMTDSGTPRYSLSIVIGQGGADIIAYTEGELSVTKIDVDASVDGASKILEEVVYSMPRLLNDRRHVEVCVNCVQFVVLPTEIADNGDALSTVAARLWPDFSGERPVAERCSDGLSVVFIPGGAIEGYIERTFADATLHHRMASLIKWCNRQSRPVKDAKMFVFVSDNTLDIVTLGSDSLVMANSFACDNDDDRLYYIMAAVEDCKFDQVDDEMVVVCEPEEADSLIGRLRDFINSLTIYPIIEKSLFATIL